MLKLILLIFSIILEVFSIDPIINLPNGKIRGALVKSPIYPNSSFYAYQGIPFAEPPTGKLRFQAPQPVKNWNGVKDVIDNKISCYQTGKEEKYAREDCLYLSVFTPVNPLNATKLEVLVFIYGGGFISGHMDYGYSHSAFLMEENIILVNFNYRVGPLGFLSSGDKAISGNMGLKDQRLALKWVQQNIHLFGGHAKKVTIMGQSAGSASVTYQMLSPGSAGLFRAAIGCSGSALNDWAHQQDPAGKAYGIAAEIDPNFTRENSTQELLVLLQSVSVDKITKTADKYKTFSPVVEVAHDGAFLSEPMYGVAESGRINMVPVLMGFNSEEALDSVKDVESWKAFVKKTYDGNPQNLVDYDLFITNNDIKRKVGEEIKKIYVGNGTFENDPGKGVQFNSDNLYIRAIIKFAELIAQYVDVYFYQFSYHGEIGGTKILFNDTGKVAHSEDQRYFWSYFKDYSKYSKSDVITVQRYNKLIANFIKYLNPTPIKDTLFQNQIWPTVKKDQYNYLDIDNNLTIQTNPRKFSYKKWVNIYENYGKKPFVSY